MFVQPTREQFEFVLVAEEKQDEETQDCDDGQHGDDHAGGRCPCKMQRKKMSRGSWLTIFSVQLLRTFFFFFLNFALRLTGYVRSTHCVGFSGARLDFSSAFSLAAASLVFFCGRTTRELELKAKPAHFFPFNYFKPAGMFCSWI